MSETILSDLHHIPLLNPLPAEEKRRLARQFERATFVMGQPILGRECAADYFYVIVTGEARKIGVNAAGEETNLGLLRPGEHFGEHHLLVGEPAIPLTIRAASSLETLRLDRRSFEDWVARYPAIASGLRQSASSDSIRLFLKHRTMFAPLGPEALRSLPGMLEVRMYEPGECLVHQGEPSDTFYLLKSGSAFVEKAPEAAIVNRLYAGDGFGELALLSGTPYQATVRAAEPAIAFHLSKSNFDELIRKYPILLESFRSNARSDSDQPMRMPEAPELAEAAATSPTETVSFGEATASAERSGRARKAWRWRRKFPVLLQQSEMDCGPTCLTMIARYYGLNASVNRMRERCNVGAEGTSMHGLVETLEALGFTAKGLSLTSSLLNELPTPFIAHWKGNHFIVVYAVGEHHLVVADPALGYVEAVLLDEFSKHWTGFVITMQPSGPLAALDDKEILWKRYFDYVRPFKKLLVSAIGLSVLIEVIYLMFPIMTQQIFDRVLNDAEWPLLHLFVAAMLVMIVFHTASIAVRQVLIGRLAYILDQAMLDRFYRHLFRLPYTYFSKRTSGDILTRVHENEKIRRLMTDHASELLLDGLTLVVYGGLMAYYHPRLAAISFALLPLYVCLYGYILPRMRRNLRKQFIAECESQTQIVEAVQAIATVKGLSVEGMIRGKLMHKLNRLLALRLEGNRLDAASKAASSALRSLSKVALLYWGSTYVLEGQLTVGMLAAYSVMFASFLFALEMISQRISELSEARISMERVNDVFESTPEHPRPEAMRLLPAIQGHIRFENVSFQYSRGGKLVLQCLDLELKPGHTVALVGRSGSGKSTIAHLLLKLLEPTSGAISVDGYPLREVHAASLRRQVGVVQQESMLLRGSVRDNIDLSGENISFEEVERAARLAGAHAFIEALPLGYDTIIGEGGIRLSGGQRQRIAIARALIHDPRIVIFDEATSALDTESERIIQHNMSEMLEGRTTLIIAHRLSTIRHADRIVVLDQGAVVESGTHEQLIERKGFYHHLLEQQVL
ncbi:Vitamin B12 import ATP-binding protein BtuD [Paenibacillus solanacearum]|uniref:Vitamin B12 import ATP-binding protein BtuD n=1 Tax=Paenibacillus solanacearum TaxID=2048548 RepID=A0A916JYA9_9BACL|nr:peptidase domain-containing ABC transporter [Paenibacillus solanacearum]CAG7610423.1 Vitamin B12 import ATP-binding protein BtuD [Paenibacillus solanacearum]